MRRTIFVISIILSLLFTSQASYAAKAQVGQPCKKAGAIARENGLQLVCSKVKRKLVWTKKAVNLPSPKIEVEAGSSAEAWNVRVLNSRELVNVTFSFSYACDGGAWKLFAVSKNSNEVIYANSGCKEIDFKVFFVDENRETKTSNYVNKKLGSPGAASPTPSPSPSSLATLQLLGLSGVQKMNLPTEYVGERPFAKILFRWPLPSNQNLAGFVISYQDLTMVAPPCDLTKSLCESPKRLDAKIYDVPILNPKQESIEIGNLKIDNNYEFRFCLILGSVDRLKDGTSLTCSTGFSQILSTDTEKVPLAPKGVLVGSVSKAIEIELQEDIKLGYKVIFMVIGGQFGAGKQVGSLTSPGKIKVDAAPGEYQVTAWSVTPSGINGNPSTVFTVSVKP